MLAGAIAALQCIVHTVHWFCTPSISNIDLVTKDAAHALFAIQSVLDGQTPYADFFWQYGPLPLLSGVFFTFGTNAMVGLALHSIFWSTTSTFLLTALFARSCNRIWQCLVAGLLAVALSPVDGQKLLYFGMEISCFTGLALLWRSPDKRSLHFSAAIGLIFGLLQAIKFGSAFVAGAAWLLVDLSCVIRSNRPGVMPLRALKSNLLIGATFLIVEFAFILVCWCSISNPAWKDPVFPFFILKWYAFVVHPSSRLPSWVNWRFFGTFQWPYILGVLGLLISIFHLIRPTSHRYESRKLIPDEDPSLDTYPAVLIATYMTVASLVYFRHANHFVAYGWLVLPGIPYLLTASSRLVQITALITLLPAIATLPIKISRNVAGLPLETLVLGTSRPSVQLWLTPNEWRSFHELETLLKGTSRHEGPSAKAVFLNLMGSGYHYHLDVRPAMRQTWLDFPGAIGDWEVASASEQCASAAVLIAKLPPPKLNTMPPEAIRAEVTRMMPFSASGNERILRNFSAPFVSKTGWVVLWNLNWHRNS